MNADEIVKMLREAPNYNAGTGTSTIEDEAADCIEALQAQLAELWLCGNCRDSRGCNMEYGYAKAKGIPIKFITS